MAGPELTPQEQLRQRAVEAWFRASERAGDNGRRMVEALCILRESAGTSPPKRLDRFLSRAVANWEERGTIRDAPRTGAPTKVTDEEAVRAVELLWAGFKDAEGQQQYYSSLQHALDTCPALEDLRRGCAHGKGVTAETLLTHMKRVEPRLRKRRVEFRRELSPANRRERVAASTKLLLWGTSRLRRVFWIDAATVWLVPKGMRVLAPPGCELVVEDSRLNNTKRMQKLKFYVCVNAIFGPVMLKFVTGTTGLPADPDNKVGLHCRHALVEALGLKMCPL